MHYVRAMRPKIWPRVRFKCKVAIVPICICAVRCTNFCSGHSRLYVAAMRPYVKLQDFTLDFYFRQHWHEQLMTSHWKPTTTAINQHSASTGTTRGWTSTTPARTSLRQRRQLRQLRQRRQWQRRQQRQRRQRKQQRRQQRHRRGRAVH